VKNETGESKPKIIRALDSYTDKKWSVAQGGKNTKIYLAMNNVVTTEADFRRVKYADY